MRNRQKEMESELRQARPDLIGGYTAWHGDGTFTQVAFFTSEVDARRHEQSAAQTPLQADLLSLVDGELTYFDFTEPDLV